MYDRYGSIQIDNKMASVWTLFKFYAGERFSHCGVNVFKLFKGKDEWKIFHLVDSKYKTIANTIEKPQSGAFLFTSAVMISYDITHRNALVMILMRIA